MPLSLRAVSLLLSLLAALCLPSCGGGGGGGSGGSNGGPGNDDLGNKFGSVNGPNGGFLAGLNAPVTVVFNKNVDPASVNGSTLSVVTINDPGGVAQAPAGIIASFTVEVMDTRIIIQPTVEFTQENVTFGFAEQALFEISFSDPATGASVESVGGQVLANPAKTFFFRTPSDAIDKNPGFPGVRAFFVDDTDAVVFPEELEVDEGQTLEDAALELFDGVQEILPPAPTALQVAQTPVRDAIFVFDDAILPQSVLNPVDGSSPALRVLINTAKPPVFAPIIAPADLTFLYQTEDLTIVRWRSDFVALPPAGILIFEVTANVSDIGGNSKVSVTGDSSPSLSALVLVDGTFDDTPYELVELFDDDAQENVSATSANWSAPDAGLLTPALGGGRGFDGPLSIDAAGTSANPGSTIVPLAAVIDFDAKTVQLPTVREVGAGTFEPRVWEFSRLRIPSGWELSPLIDRDGDGTPDPGEFIVQSPGHPLDGQGAPLELLCTEDIDISGSVRGDGTHGADIEIPTGSLDDYFGQGGPTSVPALAAGAGGRGGDTILAVDGDDDGEVDTVLLPLMAPPVDAPGTAFTGAVPKLRGVTGRSTSLTATTLTDADLDLSILNTDPQLAAMLAAGELRLQPNVAVGSIDNLNAGTANQLVDENHPTFVIESVDVSGLGATTFTIRSDEGQSMVAASENIGTGYAPIASPGDSYLVGRFGGADGGDPSGLGRGGRGAEPYLVVNEGALGVTTTGGGGGGGGSIGPGLAGGSSGADPDITLNQRGIGNGITLGIAKNDSAGAVGGRGALRGTALVIDGLTLDLVSVSQGADPADLAGPALVGARLIPNAPTDGWMFTIASFDGTTFVLEALSADDETIDLLSGPKGPSGPGLTPSDVVPFLVVPRSGLGGAGGGGSGASITGTFNVSPATLPLMSPGAAGGSGGGALLLESARDVILRSTGAITARGGDGGEVTDPTRLYAAGGGGGGGSVTLRAGRDLILLPGSSIDVLGGSGAGQVDFGPGGDGGDGWTRFETRLDTLQPDALNDITTPSAAGENVGRFLGDPLGVGVSRFYGAGLANPDYQGVTIHWRADTDGDEVVETGLTWSFDTTGVDGGPEGFVRPPFRFQFNPTGVSDIGLQDAVGASPTFYEAYDLVSARTGLAFDAANGKLLYGVGEGVTRLHRFDAVCLGTGCPVVPLPSLPGVSGKLDIVAVAAGGVDAEIFLLQRGTGRVFVLTSSGVYRRTIRLPAPIEGGMTVISDGVDPAADRLLMAANRQDILIEFAVRDVGAAAPATTDLAPQTFQKSFGVSRDGEPVADLEITGLSYDAVNDRAWCVDAPTGTVFEVDLSDGNEGTSLSGVHAFSRLTLAGEPTLLSSVAFDGLTVWVVHATEWDSTTLIPLAPADLMADEFALPGFGIALPEVAKSIGDNDVFLRFRIGLDGTFVDEDHPDGPVAFTDIAIEDVTLTMLNIAF